MRLEYQWISMDLHYCLCQREDDDSSFSENQLVFYLIDLLAAGTDTTSNTLLTAFLYLMTHQDVQGELSLVFL